MTALPELEPVQSTPAASAVTSIQWLICAVACLGFSFDLYEGLMLPLIVRPPLMDLGNLAPGSREFNLWVGPHQPWRYTLLSGLIPAIPLILVRPFLPESPV